MAGLAAAGAAAGTAVMPGIGTAVGGIAGAFADAFMGGGSSGSAPQNAQSAIYGNLGMDNSGMAVNFAGTQTTGANKAPATDPLASGSLLGAASGAVGVSPVVLVGVVVLLLIWKKSKSSK